MIRRKKLLLISALSLLSIILIGATIVLALYPIDLIRSKARSFIFGHQQIDLTDAEMRIRELGYSMPLENPRIEIKKSERTLLLYNGDELIESFEMGLGSQPVGHKEFEGDGRTPEGEYTLCTRLNPSSFHLFMGISYPSVLDAENSNDLSVEQRAEIAKAEQSGTKPPWNTPLGGAVGIHGGGASDWTAGCIALSNRDTKMIYLLTELGTPVSIKP